MPIEITLRFAICLADSLILEGTTGRSDPYSFGDFGRSIVANMGDGGPEFGEEALQGIWLSVRA
jgi:hypothetical protein